MMRIMYLAGNILMAVFKYLCGSIIIFCTLLFFSLNKGHNNNLFFALFLESSVFHFDHVNFCTLGMSIINPFDSSIYYIIGFSLNILSSFLSALGDTMIRKSFISVKEEDCESRKYSDDNEMQSFSDRRNENTCWLNAEIVADKDSHSPRLADKNSVLKDPYRGAVFKESFLDSFIFSSSKSEIQEFLLAEGLADQEEEGDFPHSQKGDAPPMNDNFPRLFATVDNQISACANDRNVSHSAVSNVFHDIQDCYLRHFTKENEIKPNLQLELKEETLNLFYKDTINSTQNFTSMTAKRRGLLFKILTKYLQCIKKNNFVDSTSSEHFELTTLHPQANPRPIDSSNEKKVNIYENNKKMLCNCKYEVAFESPDTDEIAVGRKEEKQGRSLSRCGISSKRASPSLSTFLECGISEEARDDNELRVNNSVEEGQTNRVIIRQNSAAELTESPFLLSTLGVDWLVVNRTWVCGMLLSAVLSPILSVVATTFLPASVVGFAAVQIFFVLLLGRFWLKENVHFSNFTGAVFVIIGMYLLSIYGGESRIASSVDEFFAHLCYTPSIVYLSLTFVFLLIACLFYSGKSLAPRTLNNSALAAKIQKVLFPFASGLFGGYTGICIKASTMSITSIMKDSSFQTHSFFVLLKTEWHAIIILLLTAAFALCELLFLNKSLETLAATACVPIMCAVITLSGALGGILIFQEYPKSAFLWSSGLTFILLGVLILAYAKQSFGLFCNFCLQLSNYLRTLYTLLVISRTTSAENLTVSSSSTSYLTV